MLKDYIDELKCLPFLLSINVVLANIHVLIMVIGVQSPVPSTLGNFDILHM